MMPFFIYLLKVSLSMALLFLPYRLILKKTTFFYSNRIYLLSLLIIPFIIPLIASHVSFGVDYFHTGQALYEEFISAPGQPAADTAIKAARNIPDDYMLLFYFYLSGVIVFLLRFSYSLAQIRSRHIASARQHPSRQGIHILENFPAPFAFGRIIYIPKSLKNSPDIDLILEHERSHISQFHTFDIIVAELVNIILWFNPLVYIIRNAIRLNHEYIADRSVLNAGYNIGAYLKLLSNTILGTKYLNPSLPLKDNSLKRRILMMKQSPSKSYMRLSFLSIIPLAGFLFLAFAKSIADNTPSGLPFDENYNLKITYAFGHEGPNPITKKKMVHRGVDFSAKKGTAVYATAPGKAVFVAEKGSWGKLIIIQHNEIFETRYAHLDGFAIQQGETVKNGQLIGYVGNSGLATGPHLHYEILKDGQLVNPMDFIKDDAGTK